MPDFKKDPIFAWKRITGKLKSLLRYFRKGAHNIYVLTPIAIPLIGGLEPTLQVINKFLLVLQLKVLLSFLHFEHPVLWVCAPTFKDIALVLKREAKCLLYYCVDNISYYSGSINRFVLDLEIDLLKNADLAFFVNHQLIAEKCRYSKRISHIGHGVDYEHFAKAQNSNLPVPDDMKQIPGPIVAYLGALRGLDFTLVRFLAEKNPNLSFVFIGEVLEEMSPIASLRNVYFLGQKPYALLPDYMKPVSCFGIFYQRDDIFNNYRNPKKLLECLATGKPVVSVPILEMEYFKDLVLVAQDYEQFHHLIREAIENDSSLIKERRIEYAKDHTWDKIGREVGEQIVQLVRRNV
jgi:glycosyltransferase involved in cell wall biosynthesis